MFLYPSKPREISDPEKLISTLKELGKLENYRVQIKKNGCRSIPNVDEKVTIYDRRNSILTVSTEMDWSPLKDIFPKNSLLDGELIGRKQGEVSNRLYLWDIPVCGGEDLTKVSYQERYNELWDLFSKFAAKYTDAILDPEWTWIKVGKITVGVAKSYPAFQWEDLLKSVEYEGSTGENEGIVFKDVTHPLGWNRWKTSDIKEQVKFLLKYKSRSK